MSVPREMRLLTSSLSHAAQAARNTQPSLNPILRFFLLRSPGSRAVSLSCHRLSCSALFMRAELDLVSRDMIRGTLPSLGHNTALLTTGCSQASAGQSHNMTGCCLVLLRPGLLMEARERAESCAACEGSGHSHRLAPWPAQLFSFLNAGCEPWLPWLDWAPLTARLYLARIGDTSQHAPHSALTLARPSPRVSGPAMKVSLVISSTPSDLKWRKQRMLKDDILISCLLYMTCCLKRASNQVTRNCDSFFLSFSV